MKRILLIYFAVYIAFCFSVHKTLAATSSSNSSSIMPLLFADTYPREKVYLHFDNSSYYVGDTIWFKAYTVYAENNMPSTISKPLYVEMLDQTGHITQRQIIELNSGEGHGQIILNESTMSGYYEIRALHPLDARIQRTFLLLTYIPDLSVCTRRKTRTEDFDL